MSSDVNDRNDSDSANSTSLPQTPNPNSYQHSGQGSGSSGPNGTLFRGPFRMPLWAKALIVLGLVGLASIGYLQSIVWKKPEAIKPRLAELDPDELAKRPGVKDFTITDVDGKPTNLASYKGKVVVLSFWASWCTPCLVELPTFAELEKKYHDRGLRVVPVNIDDGDEGKQFAKDFWSRNKFPFPSFFDSSKAVSRQFEVEMLPSNFVIDRRSRMVFSSFGSNDWSNPGTMDFIEGLLQESENDKDSEAPVGPTENLESPDETTTKTPSVDKICKS